MDSSSRKYPSRPIVGVGGLVIENDRVLLIRRGSPPLEGEWSIPGGALEVGEVLAKGVERELTEETGLVVRVLCLLEVFDRIIRDAEGRPVYHFVILDYLCERSSGEAHAASDVLNVAWTREEELGAFHLSDAAERVVRNAFRTVRERANRNL